MLHDRAKDFKCRCVMICFVLDFVQTIAGGSWVPPCGHILQLAICYSGFTNITVMTYSLIADKQTAHLCY